MPPPLFEKKIVITAHRDPVLRCAAHPAWSALGRRTAEKRAFSRIRAAMARQGRL
jgi:hypothetical protein